MRECWNCGDLLPLFCPKVVCSDECWVELVEKSPGGAVAP
jgi:hypothetical protein